MEGGVVIATTTQTTTRLANAVGPKPRHLSFLHPPERVQRRHSLRTVPDRHRYAALPPPPPVGGAGLEHRRSLTVYYCPGPTYL